MDNEKMNTETKLIYSSNFFDYLPLSQTSIKYWPEPIASEVYYALMALPPTKDSTREIMEKMSERITGRNIFEGIEPDKLDDVIYHMCDTLRSSFSDEEQKAFAADFRDDIEKLLVYDDGYKDIISDDMADNKEDFEKDMKSYGLLEHAGDEYLFFSSDHGSAITSYNYKLAKINNAADIINSAAEEGKGIRIKRTGDNPYFEVEASDKSSLQYHVYAAKDQTAENYTIVPMQWIEKAMKSDIGKDIETLIRKDAKIAEAALRLEMLPNEALYAIESCVLSEAFDKNEEDLHELASRIGRFDFLKFRETITTEEKLDAAVNAAYEALLPNHDAGDEYLLRTPEDKKLTDGIADTLKNGKAKEIYQMVSNLFSENRINEVSQLKSPKNKELNYSV